MYPSVLRPHKQTLTLLAICVPLFWGFLFRFITFKDSLPLCKWYKRNDFVSRKRKLHAAKQKRDTILAEVRFLRRRRNDLLQNQAFNTEEDPIRLSNSYIKSKALKGEISFDGLEAMPENSNRFLLSDSHSGETEGVRDSEVLGLKPMSSVIHHKTAVKRKISCLIKSR